MKRGKVACLFAAVSLMFALAVVVEGGNDVWTGGGPVVSSALATIAVNPLHPDTLYAVGWNDPANGDSLIYMSADGGDTWSSLIEGVPNQVLKKTVTGLGIAVHPVAPESVYVVLFTPTLYDTFLFMRSDDHGLTWKLSNIRVIEGKWSEHIVIDPVEPNRIYVSGEKVPCHYSTDGGRNWFDSNTPFADRVRTFGFVVNPLNNAEVYCGADTSVIRSTDYGVNWEELPFTSYRWGGLVQIQMSPDDTSTVMAASAHASYKDLWRTTDSGTNWDVVGRFQNDHGGARLFRIDPYDGDHMYVAAGDSFIYWTRDGGEQWWILPGRLADRPSATLIVDATMDPFQRLYTIIQNGVWAYTITDTIAPTFLDATAWPDTNYRGPYLVSAAVVDTFNEGIGKNYGIIDSTVILNWRYKDVDADTFTVWYEAAMRYYPSLRQYRQTIPPVPNPYRDWYIHYFMGACDSLFNCSAWPEGADTTGGYYEFLYDYQEEASEELPDERTGPIFALAEIAPNPASSAVTVRYSLAELTHTRILVYNIVGQVVRTLVDDQLESGHYQVVWDGKDEQGRSASAGVYFCRMEAEPFDATQKFTLMK